MEYIAFVGPSMFVLGVLTIVLAVALRRHSFWRTAAVASLLIGMVLGATLWLLAVRSNSYLLQELVTFLSWPVLTFALPAIGDIDSVVLIPLVPFTIAVELATVAFAVFCAVRFVTRPKVISQTASS